MLFSAGCLTEAPARKWRWRLLERLPSQRRCSNPERLRVLIEIAGYPTKWHLLIIFSNAQVCSGGKRKKDEISVDCLDFNKKILHTAWHPQVRLEANNLSLLLILSHTQIFCYWSFLRPKCFVIDGFSNTNIAGEHYRCRGHEQSLPLPGSDWAQHC